MCFLSAVPACGAGAAVAQLAWIERTLAVVAETVHSSTLRFRRSQRTVRQRGGPRWPHGLHAPTRLPQKRASTA